MAMSAVEKVAHWRVALEFLGRSTAPGVAAAFDDPDLLIFL